MCCRVNGLCISLCQSRSFPKLWKSCSVRPVTGGALRLTNAERGSLFISCAVLPECFWLRKVPTHSRCWYGAHVCLNEHTLTCYRHTPHPGIAFKTLTKVVQWEPESFPSLYYLYWSFPPWKQLISPLLAYYCWNICSWCVVRVVGSIPGQLALTDWKWAVCSANGNKSIDCIGVEPLWGMKYVPSTCHLVFSRVPLCFWLCAKVFLKGYFEYDGF